MSVRWRLGVFVVELAILCLAAWLVSGNFLPFSVWFISGALGVVLALNFIEPFFSRPADVVVSGISVALIVLVADRQQFELAWWVVGGYAAAGVLVAVLALTARGPGGSPSGRGADASARAYQLMKAFSGKILYSAVFVVAVLSEFHDRLGDAIPLGLAWAGVVIVSSVRWDQVILGRAAGSRVGTVAGLVAPARLLISVASSRLDLGQIIQISHAGHTAEGHLTRRLNRTRDVLLEIQLEAPEIAELFLGRDVAVVAASAPGPHSGCRRHGHNERLCRLLPVGQSRDRSRNCRPSARRTGNPPSDLRNPNSRNLRIAKFGRAEIPCDRNPVGND